MSGVFHRVASDPAVTIAPNASQSGTPVAAQDADTAAAAQFSAVANHPI
jgi:hypothetical protein